MKKNYPPLEIAAPLMFALIFILALIYSAFEPHVEDVDTLFVKRHTGMPGYILVDARPEESFMGKSPRPGVPGGHIPGAINFPLENLSMRTQLAAALLAKEGITKDKTIILYCNTGVLSGRMADLLIRRFNFSSEKIKNYRGSTVEWVKDPRNVLLPEDHETGFLTDEHSEEFKGK